MALGQQCGHTWQPRPGHPHSPRWQQQSRTSVWMHRLQAAGPQTQTPRTRHHRGPGWQAALPHPPRPSLPSPPQICLSPHDLKHSASLPHPVTHLFTITVPDRLAPQGGLRASFPHPGQTALGWHMCVRLCLLGPSGAKPNVYLLLLPNYRYNTTNASLSCQRDGL